MSNVSDIAKAQTHMPTLGRRAHDVKGMAWVVELVRVLEERQVEQGEITSLIPYAEVVFWVRQLRSPLSAHNIAERFDVSRATAYRWLPVLRRVQKKVRSA
jgi:DNA-binding transcriptional ArsR family regulator